MVRFLTGHYWHCSWPVQKASPGMCPCKWTFEHFLWANSCKQFAFFMCFWFKWLLSIVPDFYCVDAWWSISLPCLTAKLQFLIELVKDSERTKSKMLLFCVVLINLWPYFHDIWQIFVAQVIKSHTWDVLRGCKVQISDFKVFQGNAATYLRCGG